MIFRSLSRTKELSDVVRIVELFGKKAKAERMEEDGEVEKQRVSSVEATTNPRRSCFEACWPVDRSVQTETERLKSDSDEAVAPNNTVAMRAAHCDSIFTSLNFWGANIVIFANAIYIVPYVIVVLVFVVVPGLSTRAYNKAVICYNVTQIIENGILIGFGASALCHVSIYSHVYKILGLTLMFLTISSTNWLLMICIDMTLAITRCRRALASNDSPTNYREAEKRKFLTYAGWTLGGSLIPTALACVAELSPLLPNSSPVRPNFGKFEDGANLTVILYVTTIPALTCLANTVLFLYTSYKMIRIQKSAKLAVTNSNKFKINTARKRYFLFLRLYLLMDAPWVTSALAAAITDLWILKFLRMIQPILMLLAVLPSRTTNRVSSRIDPTR